MYSNFDFNELERATREQMAKLYKESFDEQEYVDEECQNKTYNKIKKILECPEMEKCHPFLYSLDMENVNECDTKKVDDLYQLGLDRGMIEKDDDEVENGENLPVTDGDDGENCEGELCGGPSDSLTGQQMIPQPVERKPIFTVMYSAQKDGSGSMGEFYSMAPTIEGAKEDCKNQLMASGFGDIMIMAVDQSFPAVNTDVDDAWVDKSLDNVSPCCEDDSEEFLKQETGDMSDETAETSDSEKVEDDVSTDSETEENAETSDGDTKDDEEVENVEDTENDSEEKVEKSEDDVKEEEDKKDDGEEEDSSEEKEEKDDSDEEKEDDEEEKEEKKLTAEEKTVLKDEYTKIFKDVLKKMELEKSVSDMTLEERTDFYAKLAEKWTKNDPSEFMNDKDQEKLNKVVVKKDVE